MSHLAYRTRNKLQKGAQRRRLTVAYVPLHFVRSLVRSFVRLDDRLIYNKRDDTAKE